jgi:hypothetical protein
MGCDVFFARRQRGTWLFGLEADIQGSNERGSADVCTVAGCALGTAGLTANYSLDWFGTARGRVGFLPTDRVLSTRPAVWLTANCPRPRR